LSNIILALYLLYWWWCCLSTSM